MISGYFPFKSISCFYSLVYFSYPSKPTPTDPSSDSPFTQTSGKKKDIVSLLPKSHLYFYPRRDPRTERRLCPSRPLYCCFIFPGPTKARRPLLAPRPTRSPRPCAAPLSAQRRPRSPPPFNLISLKQSMNISIKPKMKYEAI